jgi:dienelactone hydrolase
MKVLGIKRYLVAIGLLAGLLLSSLVQAEIKTEEIRYQVDGEEFTGYLAYDASIDGKRPGILVVHEWWGHNSYVRKRAEMLARLGYTAFALDMYGSGKLADHPEQAGEFMRAVISNMPAAEKRFLAARALLSEHRTVADGQIAALGYCFGGGTVLHMARQGADLRAVISYHGSLATQTPAQPGEIKARVLVFNGADDPMVPAEQVAAFEEEMSAAGVDYKLYNYQGAKHSFTNPGADAVGQRFGMPLAYDAKADADSWRKTREFLNKIFNAE